MTRRIYISVAGVAALIAAGLIGASLVGANAEETAAPVQQASVETTLLQGIPQSGTALGRPDAPVTLVEFADVQCPYCATWSNTAFPALVRDYVRPGKVRLVFAGMAFVGPDSERGLRFALAAGRQGKLWDVLHLLYASQGAENSGWVRRRPPARSRRRGPGARRRARVARDVLARGRAALADAHVCDRARGARDSVIRRRTHWQGRLARRYPKPRRERLASGARLSPGEMNDRRLRFAVAALARLGAEHRGYLIYARVTNVSDRLRDGWLRDRPELGVCRTPGVPVALLGLAAYLFVLRHGVLRQSARACSRRGDCPRRRSLRCLPPARAADCHRRAVPVVPRERPPAQRARGCVPPARARIGSPARISVVFRAPNRGRRRCSSRLRAPGSGQNATKGVPRWQ